MLFGSVSLFQFLPLRSRYLHPTFLFSSAAHFASKSSSALRSKQIEQRVKYGLSVNNMKLLQQLGEEISSKNIEIDPKIYRRLMTSLSETKPQSSANAAKGEQVENPNEQANANVSVSPPQLNQAKESVAVKEFIEDDTLFHYQSQLANEFKHLYAIAREKFGVSKETLERYKVGAAKCTFDGSEKDCFVFPLMVASVGYEKEYYQPSVLKFSSISRPDVYMLNPEEGEVGLFGLQTAQRSEKEILLVETEFEAMALNQETGLATISLPLGQSSFPRSIVPLLNRFEKIVLWMSSVENSTVSQIAETLGMDRCLLVNTRALPIDQPHPQTSVEALLAGIDMKAILRTAKPIPHQRLITFNELQKDIFDEIQNPATTRGTLSKTVPSFNRILKGHRKGELTIFTGPTGIGKTTVLSHISLDFCTQGVRTLWGSFEIKNHRLAKKMMSQYSGEPITMANFDEVAETFSSLPMYFMKFFGSSDVTQVLNAMDHAVYVYDVQHIILDNLQFMTSGQGKGYEKFDLFDLAIEKFRAFATTRDVHITLVIHPRKLEDDARLGISSVFGTAKATQEADNLLILQYGEPFRYIEVRKNRFDGELGKIPYKFEKRTLRISELNEDELLEFEQSEKSRKQRSRNRPNSFNLAL